MEEERKLDQGHMMWARSGALAIMQTNYRLISAEHGSGFGVTICPFTYDPAGDAASDISFRGGFMYRTPQQQRACLLESSCIAFIS